MERIRLRTDGLSWRLIDDEVVVLDAVGGVYFSGNQTAALVWDDLAAGAGRDQLVTRLVQAYGVDAATASKDVDGFLDELRDRALLEE